MTKFELKGRILELIAQIEDQSALEDIYRLAGLTVKQGSDLDEEDTLTSPGPALGQGSSDSKPQEDDLTYPKYFSY